MKNQNGITLIALVITIIVLLILAGVAIAMLSGENGILKKATEASAESKVASAKELVITDLAEVIADYYDAKYVDSNTTDTTDALTYINAHWDSSDATQYTVTKSADGKDITVTIVPVKEDGSQLTGKVATDGKINWD